MLNNYMDLNVFKLIMDKIGAFKNYDFNYNF